MAPPVGSRSARARFRAAVLPLRAESANLSSAFVNSDFELHPIFMEKKMLDVNMSEFWGLLLVGILFVGLPILILKRSKKKEETAKKPD